MPHWFFSLPWDSIREAAETNSVPWKLIGAITMAESAGNTWAARFEPNFIYTVDVKGHSSALAISEHTEELFQKTSWGLCQVMGGVARELGFNGNLPELCKPKTGLRFACLKIKQIAGKYSTQNDIIASYNAGSVIKRATGEYINQKYVDRVSGYLRELDSVLKL